MDRPPVPFRLAERDRELLAGLHATLWNVHTRESAFQAAHLVVTDREFPGNADKYHALGVQMHGRYAGACGVLYQAELIALEIEGIGAAARWLRWLSFLPAVRRRLVRLEVERASRVRSLAFHRHDLDEYLRVLRMLAHLRETYRARAVAAGETLDWDEAEEKRWQAAILFDEDAAKKFAEKVSAGYRAELLAAAEGRAARPLIDQEIRRVAGGG